MSGPKTHPLAIDRAIQPITSATRLGAGPIKKNRTMIGTSVRSNFRYGSKGNGTSVFTKVRIRAKAANTLVFATTTVFLALIPFSGGEQLF